MPSPVRHKPLQAPVVASFHSESTERRGHRHPHMVSVAYFQDTSNRRRRRQIFARPRQVCRVPASIFQKSAERHLQADWFPEYRVVPIAWRAPCRPSSHRSHLPHRPSSSAILDGCSFSYDKPRLRLQHLLALRYCIDFNSPYFFNGIASGLGRIDIEVDRMYNPLDQVFVDAVLGNSPITNDPELCAARNLGLRCSFHALTITDSSVDVHTNFRSHPIPSASGVLCAFNTTFRIPKSNKAIGASRKLFMRESI